jgi:hypothetical protein
VSRALLQAEAAVDVAADRLWAVLVDWPRQGEWIPLTTVRTVLGDGRGVGGRIAARSGVGRIGITDPMVITHWEPPRRCEVLHLGPVVRGEGGFEVTAIGAESARMRWWESFELPLGRVGRAGWRLTGPLCRAALDRSLARLRRLAEDEDSSGGTRHPHRS